MEIKINNKIYLINVDVRFGVLYKIQKYPEDLDNHIAFFKEVLIPRPTEKEILNFRDSDTERIFKAWGESKEEQVTDLKKKRSL